jgi:hypothetical protein
VKTADAGEFKLLESTNIGLSACYNRWKFKTIFVKSGKTTKGLLSFMYAD